jgi:hypothetical protein
VKEHSFTPEQKPKSVWPARIAGGYICLAVAIVLFAFYRQEAGTKFVMIDVPTVLVVVELENTPTRTTTPTRTPSPKPSITPTSLPIYGQASPQPVMIVPKWTPTPIPTKVSEPDALPPCSTITPHPYDNIPCAGDIEKT